MDQIYIIGALVVAVLLLFYLAYAQSKRGEVLSTDIKKVYEAAVERLKEEIDAKNAAFKESVDA